MNDWFLYKFPHQDAAARNAWNQKYGKYFPCVPEFSGWMIP